MKNTDDKVYLEHILQCADDIALHLQVGGGGRQAFMGDSTVQAAVLRTLQVMAESTTRLSVVSRERMQAIPWQDIRGMRNILVHDYLGDLDLVTVWETIEHDLPVLRSAVQQYYTSNYE